MEQGDEPGEALDVLLEHHVGAVETPLTAGPAGVVDLHHDDRHSARRLVERRPGER
jgi:hypothetical protein